MSVHIDVNVCSCLCLCVHASDTLSNSRQNLSICLAFSFFVRAPCVFVCVSVIVIAMCHCCCLYFQFSRSEVYSWYVLYSFRKRSDSRLDPIEDVYSHQKQSYSLSLTQYLFTIFSSFRSFVRCVVAFFVYFFCILSISKSVCVYFQNYFLFSNFGSLFFPSKYLSCMLYLYKTSTLKSTCNAFHSYRVCERPTVARKSWPKGNELLHLSKTLTENRNIWFWNVGVFFSLSPFFCSFHSQDILAIVYACAWCIVSYISYSNGGMK